MSSSSWQRLGPQVEFGVIAAGGEMALHVGDNPGCVQLQAPSMRFPLRLQYTQEGALG
jgi:hypothetical protein